MLDIIESYGFETDDELTEARKVEALNETYWDAASRQSWPFLQASVILTFAGGSATPSNDPGDIGEVITANRADGVTQEPWRLDDFHEQFGNVLTNAGSPLLYYFEGEQIKFYPVPSASDTVLVKYVRIPAELIATTVEADIRWPKRYHRSVLVIGTLSRLAVMQDDTDLGAAYERLYEKSLNLMIEDVFRQQAQRPDYIHVNDTENWDYS